MIYTSKESEQSAILNVAQGMLTAARTAPKGRGIDNIETFIADGEDKQKLADKMREIGGQTGFPAFSRDAGNVEASGCVVFVGVANKPVGLNCGFCGYETCGEMAAAGARCAFNFTDLGIAVGSAAAFAADNRVDNRVMYTAGKAALQLGWFPESIKAAYGIPLSVSGKSPYFDRG
ncbi:ferredoxin [Clostridia bacterium]|nr:ferredoxin [Clostridia bacterium]